MPGTFCSSPSRIACENKAQRQRWPALDAVLFAFLLLLWLPAGKVLAATFTVNSTASTPDAVPGDRICDDGSGHCTLAAAAMEFPSCGDMTIVLAVEGTIDGSVTFADTRPCLTRPSRYSVA
jgi:hypothetical protein